MDFHPLPSSRLILVTALSALALGACQRQSPDAAAAPAAPAAVPAAAAYVPPSTDQLDQLVAPIALFPDKLLAQTLAASVYPEQVMAAQNWLGEHRTLSAIDRLQAAAAQPWDPSVKALTAFPDVVAQLAGNGDWTRALGDAYAHDPNQVLDAVQVMRQRAQAQGHLRSTPQQRVRVVQRTVATPAPVDADAVPPPTHTIVIEPAQPDVVYVPHYDPDVVYGAPIHVYREYHYLPPRPYYDSGDLVAAGVISFGVGVLVGNALDHHHGVFGWLEPAPPWHAWGWNNWGVNWNAPPSVPNYVVYRNSVYAPRITIINNHYDNRSDVHNDGRGMPAPVGGPGAQPTFAAARVPGAALAAAALGARTQTAAFAPERAHPGALPQTMPHFTAQMLQPGRPVAAMPPAPRLPASGMPAASSTARDRRMPSGVAPHGEAPGRTLAMAAPDASRMPPSMPVAQFHGRPLPQALTPVTLPRAAAANPGGMPTPHLAEPPRPGERGMPPAHLPHAPFAHDMARAQPLRQTWPPAMPREAIRGPTSEQRMARFAPPHTTVPRPPQPRPAPERRDGHRDHDRHRS